MSNSMVARCIPPTGLTATLYRHSRTGETLNAKPGESLPGRKGSGNWYPLATDNVTVASRRMILIGKGLMWLSDGPEVALKDEINIFYTGLDVGLGGKNREGLYRVVEVTPREWARRSGVHIQIEHVGDMDPSKLVYLAGLANC